MQDRIYIISYLIITTLLILLLGGVIIFVVYLYQQKRLIHQNNYKALKLQYEKDIIKTQLEVQENMFRHISQEIHDNIGLTLTLAKLQLNTLNIKDEQNAHKKIFASSQLLSESIDHLKNISRSLNSDLIKSYGLIKAVETEIDKITELGKMKVFFDIIGEPVYMDSQKELIIFRIIQESLNNVIKHANASRTNLTLKFKDILLEILVNDNGKGFDFSAVDNIAGLGKAGLKNMNSRAKMIRGEMKVISSLGNGTTLIFIIPI